MVQSEYLHIFVENSRKIRDVTLDNNQTVKTNSHTVEFPFQLIYPTTNSGLPWASSGAYLRSNESHPSVYIFLTLRTLSLPLFVSLSSSPREELFCRNIGRSVDSRR